jgi:hypothetical protein
MEGKMTVLYESPFWVGIFERIESGKYQAARFVFGADPTEPQLLQFALSDFLLLQFSRPADIPGTQAKPANFKRRMREIKKQMDIPAGSTRAQLAIQQEYEAHAAERKINHRDERDADEERRFRLKRAKRAEKHRGH